MPSTLSNYTIFQRGYWPDLLFWLVYSVLSQVVFAPTPFDPVSLLIMLGFLGAELVAVYVHLIYGLLPLLRGRRSVVTYVLITAISLVLGLLVGWSIFVVIGNIEPTIWPSVVPGQFFSSWGIKICWSIGTVMAISSGLLLYDYRHRQAERERELEGAKTEAELAFLRGQLNPHFLFNALNNIYILIERDPDTARDSLLGFSDLLRYQLYTSEAATVPLTEEVDQLRKFAAISRLRMEEDFYFELAVPADCDRSVPPMLLLPLIENAFKYNSHEGGFVRARLSTTETSTAFTITNKIGAVARVHDRDHRGGIGLTNLRRRLNLLFTDRYRLDVLAEGDRFTVALQLPHG